MKNEVSIGAEQCNIHTLHNNRDLSIGRDIIKIKTKTHFFYELRIIEKKLKKYRKLKKYKAPQ